MACAGGVPDVIGYINGVALNGIASTKLLAVKFASCACSFTTSQWPHRSPVVPAMRAQARVLACACVRVCVCVCVCVCERVPARLQVRARRLCGALRWS